MKLLECFKSKLNITSTWLILALSLHFEFVLNLAFWQFVLTHIHVNTLSMFVFGVSLIFFILAPLYIIFNLIIAPYVGKPLTIVFLLTSSAANYFMFRYGQMIDTDMIRNIFETNTREALDLITFSGIVWVSITGIIPAILLVLAKIRYKPWKKEILSRFLSIVLALLILCGFAATSYKEYASFGRNNRNVRKIINTVNYTYSTFRYVQRRIQADRKFKKLDELAKLMPYEDPLQTVMIVVVGETARAKNFSLYGYERNTNPLLAKQDVVVFNDTTSCGTATAISLPCMFSHLNRKDFDVDDASYMDNLLDILMRGNYEVIWMENDDGCKGVCKRAQYKNMVTIQNPKFCKGTYCHDESLLDHLEDTLANLKGDAVIVLHTMGSHGPTYYQRYPEKFKVFKPTCDTAEIQTCSREEIVNTYDNTILYTDFVVSSAIDILKKFPKYESGLIYVSDHGESLGENNIYLHGLPYGIAPDEQKRVPMILWMSENMKMFDHIDYDCLKEDGLRKTYSHDHLFHSMAGLLEVKTDLYKKNMDMFEGCRLKPLPF